MSILDCSIDTFENLLNTLDETWSSIWPSFSTKNVRGGLSFGSCYTVCGSLGYTNVTDVNTLVPNISSPGGPIVQFTNCGLVDKAMIVVPLASTVVTFNVLARASGLGELWPDDHNQTIDAHLSGLLLISIPRNEKTLQFSKPEVDISFQAVWAEPWPDNESNLFPSVPVADLLKDFTTTLQKEARKDIVVKIMNAIQSADRPLNCTWPIVNAQTCQSTTEMPVGACHPCDTCCNCMIQQRCDGECSECACVHCNESILWRIVLFVSAALMLVISVALIISWQ